MPTDGPAIPLARWASRELKALAALTRSTRIAELSGDVILGERGSNGRFTINGAASAGIGASRLMPCRDGNWLALTLLRDEDRALLPALFLGAEVDGHDPASIAAAASRFDCAELVARGRDLGLPIAAVDEKPASPPVEVLTTGKTRARETGHRPLVVDLSAIWAGPLAGHLLWLAGAEVVKVESPTRPDLIRRDDPSTFGLINQGKASVLVDFASEEQKASLVSLIRLADFVIESSRPRALKQLGIDADLLVREVPGLVWLSVTGHGVSGEPANWAGIGNDCAVAGGLTRAMADVTGQFGYVGDATADPLTGITGAREGWAAYQSGRASRIGLSMSAITARALAEERRYGSGLLDQELRDWGAATGQQFPSLPRREMLAPLHELGADTQDWLPC